MLTSALSSYVTRVRRHSGLTRQEEIRLARRIRMNGDRSAAKTLVTAHLGLVVRVARTFRHMHPNLLELIQEGNLALIRAVHRYDPERAVTLAAYATSWVRTYIARFILANVGFVVEDGDRDGESGADFARDLRNALRASEAEIGDDAPASPAPELEDLDLMRMALDIEDHGAGAPDALVEARQERLALTAALPDFQRGLTPRELDIFNDRFFSETPSTLSEKAAEHGLSAERIRQIERQLTQRLRLRLTTQSPTARRAQASADSAAPPPAPPTKPQRSSGNASNTGDSRTRRRICLADNEPGPAARRKATSGIGRPAASKIPASLRSDSDR
jgi:RNA polymerase sigma-32 factor